MHPGRHARMLPGAGLQEALTIHVNGQCSPLCITKDQRGTEANRVCETTVKIAHFGIPDSPGASSGRAGEAF